MQALHLNGLLPRVMSGTSAGSIVRGGLDQGCCHCWSEVWSPLFLWGSEVRSTGFGKHSRPRYVRSPQTKGGSRSHFASEQKVGGLNHRCGMLGVRTDAVRSSAVASITATTLEATSQELTEMWDATWLQREAWGLLATQHPSGNFLMVSKLQPGLLWRPGLTRVRTG